MRQCASRSCSLVAAVILAAGCGPSLLDAAYFGRTEEAERLLEEGADVGARTEGGDTPLHVAADKGHADIVRALLAHGAEISARDSQGDTPLHAGANRGHRAVVELLLAKGADPNATDSGGWTPLHNAGSREVAGLLLSSGAKLKARSADGGTPLLAAALLERKGVVEFLIEAGADPKARDNSGWTALHLAALGPPPGDGNENVELAKLLIERGLDVNARDIWGGTPLHQAADARPEMVKLLLAHGAEIDATSVHSSGGDAPLHKAALYGSLEAVRLLVEKGADVGLKDSDGNTALDMAVAMSESMPQDESCLRELRDVYDRIAAFLREHGGKE
ncbi:MAG: ankyrin repeat domain-containing protein [Planctomycetota bacterium]|jgi:ankyrin repeat protein